MSVTIGVSQLNSVFIDKTMVAGNKGLVLTAVVAFPAVLPHSGREVILSTMGMQSPATLRAITPQPSAGDGSQVDRRPHWSQMALIEMELSQCIPEIEGESRSLTLLDPVSRETIACGTTIPSVPGKTPSPGLTVWLTGLSGAGKTTIARELAQSLDDVCRVETVDGDVVRTHLCHGLGFTEDDRRENVRRLAYLARMFAATGAVTIVSAISPYRTMRDEARKISGRFLEVYVNAPLSVCEGRDVKGLYEKARRGEIRSFTGIDDPYEPPIAPEIECRTDLETIAGSAAKIRAAVIAQLEG